jgi:hypothetical protein
MVLILSLSKDEDHTPKVKAATLYGVTASAPFTAKPHCWSV